MIGEQGICIDFEGKQVLGVRSRGVYFWNTEASDWRAVCLPDEFK